MKNYLLIIVSCLLFVVGCSPRITPPAEIRDSVRVEIRERIVHDTATLYIEKEVEKVVTRDTSSHLENKYGVSDAVVSEGLLHHSLETKPQYIKVPVTVEVHDTIVVEKQAQTIIQKVNELTKWQSFSMVLGWILGGLILLALILWIVRKIILKI